MYKKIGIMVLLCCSVKKVIAQDSILQNVNPVFDSVEILNNLQAILGSGETASSFALVSVSMGNRLFSVQNNRLNARQSSTSTLVFNPTIGYYHKSGFSVSAASSLLNDRKKGFRPTQFSLTPAYDFSGNANWAMGISYSRYFITDKFSTYSSPIQNDVYAYAVYKKYWLKPGIAAGYSTGQYKEINRFTVQATGNSFIDTATFSFKTFSLAASLSHDVEWEAVLNNNDAIGISTSLILNVASDSTETISHTLAPNLIRFLKRRNRLPRLSGKNAFSVQSAAVSIDVSYAIGSFTIIPQVYLDYYLPQTDENRFTQTFAIAVGYSF